MKRVGIYARVSTLDKSQDPETQLRELRTYAERRGFRVVSELVDHASGRSEARPSYKRLMAAARKREIDVVLVWRYDRFARSTRALINALTEFHELGVDFISYQEGTDTTTPQGKLVFTIMAGLAEFESSLIGERVRAGMARVREEGGRLSRPPISDKKRQRIEELVAQTPRPSNSAIAREVRVARATVLKYATPAGK